MSGESKEHGNGHYGRSSYLQLLERYSQMCKQAQRNELIERGVPDERPIKDLPIERPNFALLYGPDRAAEMSKTIEPMHVGGSSIARKRTTRGGEDIEVTDKLTMTWVSQISL